MKLLLRPPLFGKMWLVDWHGLLPYWQRSWQCAGGAGHAFQPQGSSCGPMIEPEYQPLDGEPGVRRATTTHFPDRFAPKSARLEAEPLLLQRRADR